jgi:hypothetical protein
MDDNRVNQVLPNRKIREGLDIARSVTKSVFATVLVWQPKLRRPDCCERFRCVYSWARSHPRPQNVRVASWQAFPGGIAQDPIEVFVRVRRDAGHLRALFHEFSCNTNYTSHLNGSVFLFHIRCNHSRQKRYASSSRSLQELGCGSREWCVEARTRAAAGRPPQAPRMMPLWFFGSFRRTTCCYVEMGTC